ncbi:MAG TPA: P-loop NTPase fold protein [Cyclobacteriaceae bacterium]|nr:P-loop NTPase fold protein [Cyclobacteriaceae bacterium]
MSWLILTCIYSWYRFIDPVWPYATFSTWQHLKYLDIIYLPAFFYSLLFILNLFKRKTKHAGDGFFEDNAIFQKEDDLLQYDHYSRAIVERISGRSFDSAFAIGITGEWGFGKSSFMNLLKGNLSHPNQIIIDFNPWSSQTKEGATMNFFNTLRENLSSYHSDISNTIFDYAKSIVSTSESKLLSAVPIQRKQGSVEEQFEKVNSILQTVDKQVIVFVDDLDRLYASELHEVIKLIRNTASFYNTVFIVSYDRNYLIHAIRQINEHHADFFLEKIFQVEITLPHFERAVIYDRLLENFKDRVDATSYQEIEKFLKEPYFFENHYVDRFLVTLRDVTRFSNSFLLNFALIKSEIITTEFFILELLRFKYPSVYEFLYRKKDDFFNSKEEGFSKYAYYLKNGEQGLRDFLKHEAARLSVPENQIENVSKLIIALFPTNHVSADHKMHLSIRYPSNFYKYFAIRLFIGSLSEAKFKQAFNSNQDIFNNFLGDSVKQGLAWELRSRIEDIRHFETREQLEKITKGIFHLAIQPVEKSYNFSQTVGYSGSDLHTKLDDNESRLSKRLFNSNPEELKSVIMSCFASAAFPYKAESSIVQELSDRLFKDDFIIKRAELEEINIGYFAKFLEQSTSFSYETWWFYNTCKFKKYNTEGNVYTSSQYIIPGAKELLIAFIRKNHHLKGFLETIIDYDHYKGTHLAIFPGVVELFESWEGFGEFLNSFDENHHPYLKEFKEFTSTLKEKNFQERIEFSFVHFPSSRVRD